jgi:hypothetical protein
MAGETEVLGENLPRRHFVHHKSHLTRPGIFPRSAAVGSQRLTASAMARPTQRVNASQFMATVVRNCAMTMKNTPTELFFFFAYGSNERQTGRRILEFVIKTTDEFEIIYSTAYTVKKLILIKEVFRQ